VGVQRLKVSMETSVIQQVFTATHRDITYVHILMWNWYHLLHTTLHAFFKLGLNLLIIRSWTKEVLWPPAEVKGWTQKVHHCDHRWNGSEQNKPTSDCPEHKVDTKSLAGSDTSHWGSCTYGSSKGEVSIWVLWSPAMAPWLQLDNIHSVEHHTTATKENSPSNLLQLDNCFRENKNK